MSDYVTLMGAEQVSRAGYEMSSAAETMSRAAMSFDASVDRLIYALDEHAARIEAAMANTGAASAGGES